MLFFLVLKNTCFSRPLGTERMTSKIKKALTSSSHTLSPSQYVHLHFQLSVPSALQINKYFQSRLKCIPPLMRFVGLNYLVERLSVMCWFKNIAFEDNGIGTADKADTANGATLSSFRLLQKRDRGSIIIRKTT